jgi:outer membrane protein, multidrug efflux system
MSSSRRARVALAAMLIGCSPHAVQRDPLAPIAIPDRWDAVAIEGASATVDRWWQGFGDRELDRLVERVLASNLQLRAAWARVRQGRAVARQASAALLPQLDATADARRTRQRFELVKGMVLTPTINQFQVGVAAAYEVDIWKRLGNAKAAAALDAIALRDDAEAIATTLVADVAEAWFDVVATKAQQQILREQQRVNETFLELTLLRYRQGLATALDVFQQRQQVLATRAAVEQADGILRTGAVRLAVLIGDPTDRSWLESAPVALPEPGAAPSLGVPADLLVRRPDVRAARRRAEAADHRVAVAIADRLPALRIGGSVGTISSRIGDLFAGSVFSVFGQIAAAVFDGGRRAAEVDRNRDVVDERLYQLGHALVIAIAEVDQALIDEATRRIELATIAERRTLAAQTLTEAREFYAQGQVDYLTVLTALASDQQLELAELQARRALLSARVQLYRALGGRWPTELGVPPRLERK